MTNHHNRRARHRRHKRAAASRSFNRIQRRKCGLPICDEPVTLTELIYRDREKQPDYGPVYRDKFVWDLSPRPGDRLSGTDSIEELAALLGGKDVVLGDVTMTCSRTDTSHSPQGA